MAEPRVSVILPTRDRGTAVLAPIAAIRRGSWQDFEICVIDQSDSTVETAVALAALDDLRIRHVPTQDRGLARALNGGTAATLAPLIAVTGDDCEPAADWLATILTVFDSDATIGVVHGNVEPCPHDERIGFVQASLRDDAVTARTVEDLPKLVGTSANMAVRRVVVEAIGGFDESLGVGGTLKAAEDFDFALRTLLVGWAVCEHPAARVTHRDVWPIDRRDALIDRNWFGTGAVFSKLARLRPWSAIGVAWRLARRWVARPVGVSSSLGGGRRWLRLSAFARGFLFGLTFSLTRGHGHFATRLHRGVEKSDV
jgi:glycosyltransferase involved in cell wall biosynthesis